MRRLSFLLILSCSAAQPEAIKTLRALARFPRTFEPNLGQAPPEVQYLSHGPGYAIYLSANEVAIVPSENPTLMLNMRLVGASSRAKFEAVDPLPARTSYFIGNDPSEWRTGIPNYAKVALRGAYPGVDLIFYRNGEDLEYDVVAAPGADLNQIRMNFEGASEIRAESNGDLLLKAAGAEIRQRRPVVYQIVEGVRCELEGGYVLRKRNEIAFEVAHYDAGKPLVIDPTIVYSTYLGSNVYDSGSGIAVDFAGNTYVASTTAAFYSGLTGAYGSHVFVTKISPLGTLVYSLLLSGSRNDNAHGIAVDSAGNAYVTGSTQGGFPIVNAVQPNFASLSGLNSGFVTKINPLGNGLVYSTYLGGTTFAAGVGIAVDAARNVVIAGYAGGGFPTVNAVQSTFGGGPNDAFVAKINAQGSTLIYSTYLGGSGSDSAYGVALDSNGDAFVTGTTAGGFPVISGLQSNYGGGVSDAFVSKLDSQGSLVYSTYLGGRGDDQGVGIAVDASGNAYVTGYTSGEFPLVAPLQSYYGGLGDAFVSEINSQGTGLVYSTYLGGAGADVGTGITVDPTGNAYVTGSTGLEPSPSSISFPIKEPVQAAYGGGDSDAFVLEISAKGANLIYSTYLGGSGRDAGVAIALGIDGNVYVTGGTTSNNFPTLSALQPSFGTTGVIKAFVTVLSDAPGTAPLFGSLDTPVDNTNNVVGAIPVTGWALSIFALTNVEIYRDPVGNEPTGPLGLVFVGHAAFIPGTRPDVHLRYPAYPNADRAGWGYLLLTNLLPNNGNGTFHLHAIASDSAGNVVELGAPGKTIVCNNAAATKPFGTIDTPAPGTNASGSQFLNFGWALTPGASFMIPADGSTITVMVDGVPLGHPTYNQYRADIATLFPNYTNSQGAVGFFYLDTARLANGLHTISWTVCDDHNRCDGIGSRYFASVNLGSNVPEDEEPIEPTGELKVRRGFDLNREFDPVEREGRGGYFIEAEELDRIELHAGAIAASFLPIGSTLKSGVFYWQLGPGFLGEYRLVLTRPGGDTVPVRILVGPKNYSQAAQ